MVFAGLLTSVFGLAIFFFSFFSMDAEQYFELKWVNKENFPWSIISKF